MYESTSSSLTTILAHVGCVVHEQHVMHLLQVFDSRLLQVNLLASVLKLDREHSNTLIFSGNALNPQIDVRFKAPGLSARIHSRAAVWHSNVTITSTADTRGQ